MNTYEMVTNRIIEKLNEGIIPWQKGWTGTTEGAYNLFTGKPYNLINQMLLNHQDAYVSFKQCERLGGRIKKGAHHEKIATWFPVNEQKNDAEGNPVLDENGNPVTHTVMRLKPREVFWIGDTTLERPERKVVEHAYPDAEAEGIILGYVIREEENGLTFIRDKLSNQAYYSPIRDEVVVPRMSQFKYEEEYYSTAFHELTHSTGAQKRLNRLKVTELAAFGSEDYSKEELVAELGAAMLGNICGIESEKSFRNSAAYIQSWIKALKDDQRLIVSASSKAEKAVEYILTGKKGEVK